MVTKIPDSWKYNEELEMLFLFYQCADELTSVNTNDTYMVPLHNSMTLTYEISSIYNALEGYGLLERYYAKYINVIINEFLECLKDDKILKGAFGQRLDSIVKGFEEAKLNPKLLKRWINQVHQSCDIIKYIEQYRQIIIDSIISSNNKKDLITCSKRYFSSLIFIGYTREFLFEMTKIFFQGKISNKNQIIEFLNLLDCEDKRWEFLILLDLNSIDYLDSISDNLVLSRHIKKIDVEKERKELCEDINVAELYREYDKMFHNKKVHQKISIVKYITYSLDQYSAIEDFDDHINFIQSFSIYFKHHHLYRQVFEVLVKGNNGKYSKVSTSKKLLKRPYVKQEDIDLRIENILRANSLSREAFQSLTMAITMHSEALDSQNLNTLIRSLWTALETLFSNLGTNEEKINVIESTLAIIQKTYILKILRSTYKQILNSCEKEELKELKIETFPKFIEYFSCNEAESMKPLYNIIGNNVLLRTRIFNLRKEICDGYKIIEFLNKHETRIRWQLQRIYRTRNIATHLGMEMPYSSIIVNHLHNYFDFVVNYIVCKVCNGDYVSNISSIVFEARNDNRIHIESLKSNLKLSKATYKNYLFGPDMRLIEYEFET